MTISFICSCTECADRELLPVFHEVLSKLYTIWVCHKASFQVSVYPKKELPFFILFTAGLCSFTALLALLTHQYPDSMGVRGKLFHSYVGLIFNLLSGDCQDYSDVGLGTLALYPGEG